MTKFIINTETGVFTEDNGRLGVSFRKPPFRKATEEENLTKELQETQETKKEEVKTHRDTQFGKLLFYKTVSGTDFYLKPKPQENIFMAAYTMADGSTKEWYPYDVDGVKQFTSINITKEELMTMAAHYEVRKTNYYNISNELCFEIDALTTVEAVESHDINNIIN